MAYLKMCNVHTELIECEISQDGELYQHYYISLKDGRIIDPTASQFKDPTGAAMPPVYIGSLPDWYKPVTINATA